jgi:hypothetical protein
MVFPEAYQSVRRFPSFREMAANGVTTESHCARLVPEAAQNCSLSDSRRPREPVAVLAAEATYDAMAETRPDRWLGECFRKSALAFNERLAGSTAASTVT